MLIKDSPKNFSSLCGLEDLPLAPPRAGTPLPLFTAKKVFLFIGFIILKTTGLISRFQRKNRFWKICIGSRDIGQNVSKFDSPNQTFKFWHLLTNISGSEAYFSKPIFALIPWDQACHFEYNEAYKQKTFFSRLIKGQGGPWGVPEGGLPDHVESWNFLGSLISACLMGKSAVLIQNPTLVTFEPPY